MLSLRKFLVVLLSLGALMIFAACSGEDGKDGKMGETPIVAQNSGDCIVCHTEVSMDYMQGEHAAGEGSHTGTPCADCHTSADGGSLGTAGVTCINCHWAHDANGVIATNHYAVVDMAGDCAYCHDLSDVAAVGREHGLTDIVTKYNASQHANPSAHATVGADGTIDLSTSAPACIVCHNGAGFNKYAKRALFGDFLNADFLTNRFPVLFAGEPAIMQTGIGCSSCHDSHTTGLAQMAERAPGASAEFNMCTSCHGVSVNGNGQLTGMTATGGTLYTGAAELSAGATIADFATLDKTGLRVMTATRGRNPFVTNMPFHVMGAGQPRGGPAIDPAVGTVGEYELGNHDIMATHFGGRVATKYVWFNNNAYIAEETTVVGYGIQPSDERACSNCHDPHAVMEGGLSEEIINIAQGLQTTDHNNFGGHTNAGVASACARCHSYEGYETFITDPTATAESSIVASVDTAMNCAQCHKPGAISDPEAIANHTTLRDYTRSTTGDYVSTLATTAAYSQTGNYTGVDTVAAAIVGNSIICLDCHDGNGRGRLLPRAAATGATNIGLGHARGVAGIMYGFSVYQIEGSSYNLQGGAMHETSMAVTCVSCHNISSEGHDFQALVRDNGTITALPSFTTCTPACHTPATVTSVINREAGFDAAVAQIQAAPAYATPTTADEYGMKANIVLLVGENGNGFWHNVILSRQILFDAATVFGVTFTGDAATFVGSRP